MTALLFIAMIPIDCKITNFSLHLSYSTVVLYKGIMKVWGFLPKMITPKLA